MPLLARFTTIFLIVLLSCSGGVFAQAPADSLQKALQGHPAQDTLRVNLLNQLARLLVTQDIAGASKYSQEALELATQLHFDKGIIYAMRNQGLGANFKGNLDQQMALTIAAMKIAERMHDPQLMAVLLNDQGNIYIEENNAAKGLPYLLQSLKLKEQLKDKAEIAKTLNNIGSVYLSEGVADSAMYYLRRSAVIKKAINDRHGLAFTYENIGLSYALLHQYPMALRFQQMAKQYYEETNNKQGLAKAFIELGETSTHLRNFRAASNYFAQADSMNKALKNPKNEMMLYKSRSLLDSARGDFVSALKNYKQFATLNANYFDVQKDQYITNTTEKYESEKKQRENILLLKEQQDHLTTIRHQRMFEVTGLLLLLVLTGVTILVFRLNRQLNIKNAESSEQNKIITEQNEKLENLVMVKDRIFSVISHDLRSPLAILDGLLFLLRDEKIPPEQFRLYTNELWRDTKNTSYMMDNLLQWASSQMKGIRLKRDDFDLAEALHQEFDLLCTLARQKDVDLFSELEGPIMVYADMDMIKMVLRNLISNAVKFTPAGGRIRIFATRQENMVEVFVEDNGTGIPESEHSKIFSHLYYSTYGTQNEKGCGLGLPLSKEFIEQNQGSIRFTSAAGQGTTFAFTVPIAEEEIYSSDPVLNRFVHRVAETK
ncbi:Signal transduction histidine kinase [Chitinophaga costaii]|uniref:histidine kinase n=1 Tax=Chitinophaga costaii TaxID=1335309 RepID=A0A1C4G5J0_9BACT|nr:tetratricopeptide repeat-containing sensor histidine kinase [Chitinophaga costaii]PUZ20114.1 hypothetical protein DCM91_19465 [Chitinophaga costaii]SCC63459.1 Signal transduction histidine kinase [Chitinophaga costaii]